MSTPKGNNNQVSGGLPHSDIHGSKPIPGSPWLNAGYHVLHRLLLPRHPPNALIALDPTRKEQGRAPFCKGAGHFPVESLYIPMRYHSIPRSVVLDLEQSRACDVPRDSARSTPHLGRSARNRCVSLSTMSSDAAAFAAAHHASDWTAGPASRAEPTVKSG